MIRLTLLPAQAAEACDVSIGNLAGGEALRQDIGVELGVGTGAGHRPYVDEMADSGLLQEFHELMDGPGGMAYGEERMHPALKSLNA